MGRSNCAINTSLSPVDKRRVKISLSMMFRRAGRLPRKLNRTCCCRSGCRRRHRCGHRAGGLVFGRAHFCRRFSTQTHGDQDRLFARNFAGFRAGTSGVRAESFAGTGAVGTNPGAGLDLGALGGGVNFWDLPVGAGALSAFIVAPETGVRLLGNGVDVFNAAARVDVTTPLTPLTKVAGALTLQRQGDALQVVDRLPTAVVPDVGVRICEQWTESIAVKT